MKAVSLLLIMLIVAFSPVLAEEKKQDLQQYLQALQIKLDHAAQRANQPASGGSSVAGVRGKQQEPLSKQLYWKGKKGGAAVSLEEVQQLRGAIDQARTGHPLEAAAALKDFEQRYPKSALLPDAHETLAKLQAPNP